MYQPTEHPSQTPSTSSSLSKAPPIFPSRANRHIACHPTQETRGLEGRPLALSSCPLQLWCSKRVTIGVLRRQPNGLWNVGIGDHMGRRRHVEWNSSRKSETWCGSRKWGWRRGQTRGNRCGFGSGMYFGCRHSCLLLHICRKHIIIIVEERVLKIKLTFGDKSAIGSLIRYWTLLGIVEVYDNFRESWELSCVLWRDRISVHVSPMVDGRALLALHAREPSKLTKMMVGWRGSKVTCRQFGKFLVEGKRSLAE